MQFSFLGTHHIILLADLLAVVWIVWVMNMINWSKGVDGQMPGIVVVAAIVLGLLALKLNLSLKANNHRFTKLPCPMERILTS